MKICGVTTPEDALCAATAGADAIGLNFYPGSPRFVEPGVATAILNELPAGQLAVGVMVNPAPSELTHLVDGLPRLDAVQVYLDDWEGYAHLYGDVVPAFRVGGEAQLHLLAQRLASWRTAGLLPPAILIDAHERGAYGGTGRIGPWSALAGADLGAPVILAGGLTPDNVAEAIRRVRPAGVDVASGVEAAPGRKDAEMVRRFVRAALSALEECDSRVPMAGRASR